MGAAPRRRRTREEGGRVLGVQGLHRPRRRPRQPRHPAAVEGGRRLDRLPRVRPRQEGVRRRQSVRTAGRQVERAIPRQGHAAGGHEARGRGRRRPHRLRLPEDGQAVEARHSARIRGDHLRGERQVGLGRRLRQHLELRDSRRATEKAPCCQKIQKRFSNAIQIQGFVPYCCYKHF